MATIRKLLSGKWNTQVRSGGKILASSTHSSRQTAAMWAEEKEQQLVQEHTSFLDAGYAYCHEMPERKPSRLRAFKSIDRICAHKPMQKAMDAITLQDINACKQARLSSSAGTTCRDELMMIRRAFRWYIIEHHAKTGEMPENPCDLLTLPKPNKPRDRVVTRKELELLLGAVTPQMAVIVELPHETAISRGNCSN